MLTGMAHDGEGRAAPSTSSGAGAGAAVGDAAVLPGTPASLGYIMPGEWTPHAGCWMGFPERLDNWRDGAKPAMAAYAAVATAIAQFEPVTVCAPPGVLGAARDLLGGVENVRVVEMEMNDAWFRDVGPSFLVRPGSRDVAAVHWRFNAWGGDDGGCYDDWSLDELVGARVCELAAVPRFVCPYILEGGSIDVDGEGTVLCTEQCLLNKNRNPGLSRDQVEGFLKAYLGVSVVVWLGHGLYNDYDTDGHVDNLAKFVAPAAVLLSWTDDESDPQHEISVDALSRLSAARDARGRPITVHKIPVPGPLHRTTAEVPQARLPDGSPARDDGERLPASYVNYYIADGG